MEPYITELTPLSFLRRSADVFPNKTAIVYGSESFTYREFADAVEIRVNLFRSLGVRPGDRVAYLMPNIPEMAIAHYAVPLAGAVLVAINTRLGSEEIRYILDHSQTTILVVDEALSSTLTDIVGRLESVKVILTCRDGQASEIQGLPQHEDMNALIASIGRAEAKPVVWTVDDENSLISINYTSGTTGKPKGVAYSHRGVYLNALGELIHSKHHAHSVYLWTLPMFHCNGWSTGWAVAAIGGTQVCLREVRAEQVWDLMDEHGVTHFNGAPTVVINVLNSSKAHVLTNSVVVTTAGAPPSPATIERMREIGFDPVHVYGLTETYGPYAVCEPQTDWDTLDSKSYAVKMARQGVGMIQAESLRVVEITDGPEDLHDVPADGRTIGEIVMRGNNVMTGYFRDDEATRAAFRGGWFHSGDLGVMHPDGYVELRDRAKDIIISGGENISTVEVEQALMSHPSVLEAAVVGVPDPLWGERPKAFVVLKPGETSTETVLIAHVKNVLARYKAPRAIEIVQDLPKTSTGKIRKFEMREKEWKEHDSCIH